MEWLEQMMPDEKLKFMQFMEQQGMAGVDMSTIDPQMLRDIYDDYIGKRATIDKQREQSTAMREQGRAGLGGTQAGNVFVADSGLEALAAAGTTWMDKRAQGKADAAEGELSAAVARGQQGHDEARSAAAQGAPAAPAGPMPGANVPTQMTRPADPAALAEEIRKKRLIEMQSGGGMMA